LKPDPRRLQAVVELMAQNGIPLTLAPQTGRGRRPQIYIDAAGKNYQVRLNDMPCLMEYGVKQQNGQQQNGQMRLPMERCDYVITAHDDPDHANHLRVYVTPTAVAVPELKAKMAEWKSATPEHKKSNTLHLLRFDDAPENSRGGWTGNYGYARKWKKYYIGHIEVPVRAPIPPGPAFRRSTVRDQSADRQVVPVDVVERYRIQLAKELAVVPEAVKISIDLVYTDKDGVLRSAFIG
jgi:hypothetical protein